MFEDLSILCSFFHASFFVCVLQTSSGFASSINGIFSTIFLCSLSLYVVISLSFSCFSHSPSYYLLVSKGKILELTQDVMSCGLPFFFGFSTFLPREKRRREKNKSNNTKKNLHACRYFISNAHVYWINIPQVLKDKLKEKKFTAHLKCILSISTVKKKIPKKNKNEIN